MYFSNLHSMSTINTRRPNPAMDPNPTNFPLLSYVMTRLPSFGSPRSPNPHSDHDIEQPPPRSLSQSKTDPLIERLPHLKDPKIIAAMSSAVAEISKTRSILNTLGDRPDHETVDIAKAKLCEIESELCDQLEEISLSSRSATEEEEQDKKKANSERDREKTMYKAIIQMDEMHGAYQKLLRDAEEKLVKIYDSAVTENEKGKDVQEEEDIVDEEVIKVLKEGDTVNKVDLSGRKLTILPEAFGKLHVLVTLNLSSNQLQSLPDSIGGLLNLEELNLSSNSLQSLPDSIGLLNKKLRILNVSGNKLTSLPDSICYCKSLMELDASFNKLGYLPTNIGELWNMKKLLVQYNKIRSLPTSIGDMKSLQHLDIHFNELHGLPLTIGNLKNLATLLLGGNFSDLKELPETFGELINLEELDLSNNQIHALPDSFGMLNKLKKINLEQNPIFIPPVEVINYGVETVKIFMAKRWSDRLMEEEEKGRKGMQEDKETGWLKRSVSKLGEVASSVSEYLGSPRTPKDPVLDEQR